MLALARAAMLSSIAFVKQSYAQTVGSGHFNQLEVPEQVNAMIERFLAIEMGDGW